MSLRSADLSLGRGRALAQFPEEFAVSAERVMANSHV